MNTLLNIFSVILYVIVRILVSLLVIWIIKKQFRALLTQSMNKALIICASAVAADFVLLDTIRYILKDGTSTILFLPACLPICVMTTVFYSFKDTGKGQKGTVITFLICVPLLIFAVFAEVLSFINL
ncbi:MAG: hypothetical protein E7672_08520 [Ruminococcaceae bacterium]|nr:hypothetical protein [Oscillospiraceae bacterium]